MSDIRKGRLYLVFEYVEKNLLEVLEENTVGIDVSIRRVTTELHADRKLEPGTVTVLL